MFRSIPSPFLLVRACVYVLVLLWSIVCLAIAAHFQAILSASDLTRFVPFAIFVSCASLVVIFTVLMFSIRKNMNPVSTRLELACLGLAGTFWLALGAFLASSDSEDADVECFVSDTDTPVDVPGFTTETYHAQYRVLEAFALFNVVLIWGFGLLLFGLALRHYFKGTRQIWLVPVTGVNWFASSQPKRTASGRLPAPVTSRQRSVTKPSAAIMPSNSRRTTTEKATTRPTHKRENSDAPVYYVYMDKAKQQQQQQQQQPSSAARRPSERSQDRGRDRVQRGDSGRSGRDRVQRGDSSRSRTKQDADYWRRDVSPRR
ncbi:uncharacterized protein STEHIDRAFT_155789 [Stereum hirsutum FP-91666 SS1]|uniref:uncharacterized protein n=1 Tax=Stereum hirsutum (strain FP-91666) TaxID=721885 RepID=UPI000440C775|nr:uncharacterized protein STEHIDRAFT_155789 [Stereum hirsutum FP-91666 SS1]EIM88436.1 hypothetical protein STEHIDRAFT_155789 [Stereum hirsutum FP-91666 SS1]